MLHLALYQPEIAANVGAAIRIAACFGARLHVIEPCGFPWKSRDIDRVALDYGALAPPHRHADWRAFREDHVGRLVLLTTRGECSHSEHLWLAGDTLLIGQESAGVPEEVHSEVDMRVRIPLAPQARSLNMAIAGAVALAEARRQLGLENGQGAPY
ncbi:MAG: TrmH family RNA methyltransferase [Pseudomonadota bacterium]